MIQPAVRFISVAGDDEDAHNLLGRVKDLETLTQAGADQYMDSVILGETAYDVEAGFVCEYQPSDDSLGG